MACEFNLCGPLSKLSGVVLLFCALLVLLVNSQTASLDFELEVSGDSDGTDCPTRCKCSNATRKHAALRKQVDCSKVGFSSVPAGIPVDTKILILNGNSISRIHGELANLSQLQELHIVDNQLSSIEAGDLNGLTNLKLLYLTRNKLTNWPELCDDVGSSLTHLGVDENQLHGNPAPASYSNCTGLQSLILTKNKFPNLTESTFTAIGEAGNLKSLKMNAVGLKSVDPMALTPLASSLASLDLSDNPDLQVEKLAAALKAVTFSNQFVNLILKSTGWTHLPSGFLPSGNFPSLNLLHLDGSRNLANISKDALVGGSSITHLFLNECPLTSLDDQLAGLTGLTDLNLAKTHLSSWSPATFGSSLRNLDLSNAMVALIGGVDGSGPNPLPNLARFSDAGVRIDGNPLVCNCSLLWLTQQLATEAVKKKFYKLNDVRCTDPTTKHQMKLVDCKPVGCSSTSTTTATTATVSTPPTSGNTTKIPSIPTKYSPSVWLLPVVISGAVAGLLLLVGALLLLLRTRRRRLRNGSGIDDQQRLVDETAAAGQERAGADCFGMIPRRRAASAHPVGEPSATFEDEPDYAAANLVA